MHCSGGDCIYPTIPWDAQRIECSMYCYFRDRDVIVGVVTRLRAGQTTNLVRFLAEARDFSSF
jgi:hypothetical protein